jgi:hypothetical protein
MVTRGLSAAGAKTLSGAGYADQVHLALIKYSVLRLSLFVGSLILLYALGVRQSIVLLVLPALISLGLSYVLLARQRDAVAVALSERINGRIARRQGLGQSDADAEDADVAAAEKRGSAAGSIDVSSAERSSAEKSSSERQADGQ